MATVVRNSFYPKMALTRELSLKSTPSQRLFSKHKDTLALGHTSSAKVFDNKNHIFTKDPKGNIQTRYRAYFPKKPKNYRILEGMSFLSTGASLLTKNFTELFSRSLQSFKALFSSNSRPTKSRSFKRVIRPDGKVIFQQDGWVHVKKPSQLAQKKAKPSWSFSPFVKGAQLLVDGGFNYAKDTLLSSIQTQDSIEKYKTDLQVLKQIPNRGNTCYLASAIQVLCSIPEVRNYVANYDFSKEDPTILLREIPFTNWVRVLRDYVARPQSSLRLNAISLGHLGRQEDIQEAAIGVLTEIFQRCQLDVPAIKTRTVRHSDSPKTTENHPIQEHCTNVITLPILGKSIQESLKKYLKSYNQEEWAGDRPGTTTKVNLQFERAPETLQIFLNRFHGGSQKNHTNVSFSPFSFSNRDPRSKNLEFQQMLAVPKKHVMGFKEESYGCFLYKVQSFAVHLGSSCAGGHYISYVKKDGRWYKCNDATITYVSDHAAVEALGQAYWVSLALDTTYSLDSTC